MGVSIPSSRWPNIYLLRSESLRTAHYTPAFGGGLRSARTSAVETIGRLRVQRPGTGTKTVNGNQARVQVPRPDTGTQTGYGYDQRVRTSYGSQKCRLLPNSIWSYELSLPGPAPEAGGFRSERTSAVERVERFTWRFVCRSTFRCTQQVMGASEV